MPDVAALLAASLPGLVTPAVLTGGSGRLGTELRQLLPSLIAPSRSELDITGSLELLSGLRPKLIVHAAAYTDVARAESERAECWSINVRGTRNVARAAARLNARLVLISTDYVFEGAHGDYREDDPPGPVSNYYALSKLAAEETARGALPSARLLVVRTSFRGRKWPHPKAFSDLFTSQDYVDVIAPQVALAICRAADIPHDTLHIASRRRSSLELARERSPGVLEASRAEAPVSLPRDISLNTDRWRALLAAWSAG